MIDSDVRDLINRAIDGECTPDESRKLQAILSSDAEAKRFHADLQALVRGMAHLVPVDPPPTLKPAILRAIDQREIAVPRRKRPRNSWLEVLSLRPVLAFAGGAIAGIALFAVASGVLGTRTTDTEDFSGSLILHGSTNVTFTPGNRLTVKEGPSTVTVETGLAEQLAVVRIYVDSRAGIMGTLRIDPRVLHLEAVQRLGLTQPNIRIIENELIFENIPSGGLAILYSMHPGSTGEFHLTLSRNGERIFNDSIPLDR